jgi:N-carbamoyl-L-amino-acid hydrolase
MITPDPLNTSTPAEFTLDQLNASTQAEFTLDQLNASAPAEPAPNPPSTSGPTQLTLAHLNASAQAEFTRLLDGTYEHSPWIAEQAWGQRPFVSLAQLKHALAEVVRQAGQPAQLSLIRAHPELAGKAMVSNTLSAESTNEQGKAGLTDCTPEEFATLQQLNADYNAKFGFPFILAVRGPRGLGLDRGEIIATFARRLENHPDFERAECLRNIHRIAEIRLNDKFGHSTNQGNRVWDWAEQLSVHSDASDTDESGHFCHSGHSSESGDAKTASDAASAESANDASDARNPRNPRTARSGELTVTYLTPAHQACARQLMDWMRDDCGFDEVSIDAVGNVVGIYHGIDHGGDRQAKQPRRLLTGSHYDTVRNGGKYDGRLGIFVPMACVRRLQRHGRRLPYGLEVVAFAEEEGQRYQATFLGSSALTGHFDPAWLDQKDADGITMCEAMMQAGLAIDDIPTLKRDPAGYLGFVEVHIEQGPVLNALDLPLGVVTSINGSVRYLGEIIGMASHAGTTPMGQRRDAATAAAELALYVEKRGASEQHLVATVGMLEVPGGSINVVPGRCRFSLDIRATTDAVRDACAADIRAELQAICQRRGLHYRLEETMRAAAAPSAPEWQQRWERAVESLGLPVFRMSSGAGHDAMKLHDILPQAMLFVRGLNAGISHNQLESITSDDADLCVRAFQNLLDQLAAEPTP